MSSPGLQNNMPKPNKGESEKHYVGRFMGSKESQRSFPNKKQRLAVAYSISAHRHIKDTHSHIGPNHPKGSK